MRGECLRREFVPETGRLVIAGWRAAGGGEWVLRMYSMVGFSGVAGWEVTINHGGVVAGLALAGLLRECNNFPEATSFRPPASATDP